MCLFIVYVIFLQTILVSHLVDFWDVSVLATNRPGRWQPIEDHAWPRRNVRRLYVQAGIFVIWIPPIFQLIWSCFFVIILLSLVLVMWLRLKKRGSHVVLACFLARYQLSALTQFNHLLVSYVVCYHDQLAPTWYSSSRCVPLYEVACLIISVIGWSDLIFINLIDCSLSIDLRIHFSCSTVHDRHSECSSRLLSYQPNQQS